MKSIGKNARIITAGDCRPTARATAPMVAARLYAGAVEATPITTLDIRPSAPPLSPLSPPGSSGASTGGVVGTLGDMATSRWARPPGVRSITQPQRGPTRRPAPPPRGMNRGAPYRAPTASERRHGLGRRRTDVPGRGADDLAVEGLFEH